MSTFIKLVADAEDRATTTLGPFARVSMSYGALRVWRLNGDAAENLAVFDGGVWQSKGARYSDCVIFDSPPQAQSWASVIECARNHIDAIQSGLDNGTRALHENLDLGGKQACLREIEDWYHGVGEAADGAPQVRDFAFLMQRGKIQVLLDAVLAALPRLPLLERNALQTALRAFERAAAPVVWSVDDVDLEGEHGLTDAEKEEVINQFTLQYKCRQADWDALDVLARSVKEQRVPCIKVEYDPAYTGGDYSGVGRVSLLPLSAIDAAERDGAGEQSVPRAFRNHTGLDPVHIIHYTMDELCNEHGEPIEALA